MKNREIKRAVEREEEKSHTKFKNNVFLSKTPREADLTVILDRSTMRCKWRG